MSDTRWGIFGGAGFIGQHLAHSILQNGEGRQVSLLDIRSIEEAGEKAPLEAYFGSGALQYSRIDIRNNSELAEIQDKYDVIVNLAAIHREPGHRAAEYFETNVDGARNVCALARRMDCREILFTSSISVYGVHGRTVDEESETRPKTPYGQSKLKAEDIHRRWAWKTGGRLAIVRPGVVFGPGEQGNVTRLVRESLKRKRPLRISPDQAKAGIYIEELLEMFHWLRKEPSGEGNAILVNGVSEQLLTFNAYGEVLQNLREFDRKPLNVPEPLLKLGAGLLKPLGWVTPSSSKYHPERLANLTRPNAVVSTVLPARGYRWSWPLERALADWLEKGL